MLEVKHFDTSIWSSWAYQVMLDLMNPLKAGEERDIHEFDPWFQGPGVGNGTSIVFLLENLHGERRLVGYSLWSHKVRSTNGAQSQISVRRMRNSRHLISTVTYELTLEFSSCNLSFFSSESPWKTGSVPFTYQLDTSLPPTWTEKKLSFIILD